MYNSSNLVDITRCHQKNSKNLSPDYITISESTPENRGLDNSSCVGSQKKTLSPRQERRSKKKATTKLLKRLDRIEAQLLDLEAIEIFSPGAFSIDLVKLKAAGKQSLAVEYTGLRNSLAELAKEAVS